MINGCIDGPLAVNLTTYSGVKNRLIRHHVFFFFCLSHLNASHHQTYLSIRPRQYKETQNVLSK